MSGEFYSFYRLVRGHHPRACGGFTTVSNAAYTNLQLLNHLDAISPRLVLFITGENAMTKSFSENVYEMAAEPKELYVVPDATHIDLYDDTSKIPFDKIETFYKDAFK